MRSDDRRPAAWAVCAAVFVALAPACRSESRDTLRREAAGLSRAVERLREAPNEEKREPLAALTKLPCTAEDLCEFRDVCVKAYELHVRGLSHIAAARSALTGQGEAGAALGATERLAEAEKDLGEAKRLAEKCSILQTQAVTAYGL